jgi:hypothetical protein
MAGCHRLIAITLLELQSKAVIHNKLPIAHYRPVSLSKFSGKLAKYRWAFQL